MTFCTTGPSLFSRATGIQSDMADLANVAPLSVRKAGGNPTNPTLLHRLLMNKSEKILGNFKTAHKHIMVREEERKSEREKSWLSMMRQVCQILRRRATLKVQKGVGEKKIVGALPLWQQCFSTFRPQMWVSSGVEWKLINDTKHELFFSWYNSELAVWTRKIKNDRQREWISERKKGRERDLSP